MKTILSVKSFWRGIAGVLAALAIFAGLPLKASAGVNVNVNLNTQRMNVSVDGRHYATYKVSTGKRGYTTPTGNYRVQRMEKMHYSRKYNNSPMPHSIFFRGGFAIHGTGAISRLGSVASHGCVRLHPRDARELYNLVKAKGRRSTKIRLAYGPGKKAKRFSNKRKHRKSYSTRRTTNLFNNVRKNRRVVASGEGSRAIYIFGGLGLD